MPRYLELPSTDQLPNNFVNRQEQGSEIFVGQWPCSVSPKIIGAIFATLLDVSYNPVFHMRPVLPPPGRRPTAYRVYVNEEDRRKILTANKRIKFYTTKQEITSVCILNPGDSSDLFNALPPLVIVDDAGQEKRINLNPLVLEIGRLNQQEAIEAPRENKCRFFHDPYSQTFQPHYFFQPATTPLAQNNRQTQTTSTEERIAQNNRQTQTTSTEERIAQNNSLPTLRPR